jgi:hypothetical protein
VSVLYGIATPAVDRQIQAALSPDFAASSGPRLAASAVRLMHIMRPIQSAALALLFTLVAGTASAQSQDMTALAQQFGQSAKANAAALRMYSWNMRVEVMLKGDTKPAKLVAMRFDTDGVIQKTALNEEAPTAPPPG